MSNLSPANLTSQQMLSVGENSVGPFTVDNINGANYNQNPTMLPSNKILIPPHASAGTKSNCSAAAGKFVQYKSLAGGNKISRKSNMNGGNNNSGATNLSIGGNTLVNVTNTSNVKVKFATSSMGGSSSLSGDTTSNYTYFTFIRLGDST